MAPRTQRSIAELQAASDHLCYEIDMLRSTMVQLLVGIGPESVLSNAVLESFTIHARALIHFLYPQNEQDSDVLARDFFSPSVVWAAPTKPASFDAVRKRFGKEIAHLTYDRQAVDPALKGWPVIELGNEILECVGSFLRAVPRHLLGAAWQSGDAHTSFRIHVSHWNLCGPIRVRRGVSNFSLNWPAGEAPHLELATSAAASYFSR